MKIARVALFSAVAGAIALAAPSAVSAQAIVGVHGTLADVRDVSPGIGASLGFLRPTRSGADVGIDVTGTYYFPSCTGFDCDAWGAQAVLVGARPLGGRARTYVGIGAKYVEVTGSNGTGSTTGDAWGLVVQFGSSYLTESAIRPYFEFGWGFMDSSADIWELRLGLRAILGGGR
jgi:hypothetical protein